MSNLKSFYRLTLCLYLIAICGKSFHVAGTARQGAKLLFHQGFDRTDSSYEQVNGAQTVYPIHNESHAAFILDGKVPITKEQPEHSFSISPFSKGSWSPLEVQTTAKHHAPAHVAHEKDLNVIFTPTAEDVSEVDKKIHFAAESGMHNIREALLNYSRLMQLLKDDDKHVKFYIGGDEYTLSTALETLNKLVEDGERVQRMIIQASSIILAKFAGSKSD
ncbi:signal peptide containing protein [Theileria equi strain WA]|uniref:Signal peptide containing protein n=1 Tax=Theileria equi strain WA TaxID=1537102 RepID=L1LFH0_THEEQ|nr:signal peptide containing protein [Theileria equi strain WA]EKX74000.1 signal peptide containing protein [Theileria equi strain WA]|eukprot:XP_004833452.1 signal peptide containing protein [Theileria equi strain WA]